MELLDCNIMARYVTKYIKTGGQSLTVPDQSLSVREIIDRFTRGLPCPVYHESQDDDQDMDEDAHMMSQNTRLLVIYRQLT